MKLLLSHGNKEDVTITNRSEEKDVDAKNIAIVLWLLNLKSLSNGVNRFLGTYNIYKNTQ